MKGDCGYAQTNNRKLVVVLSAGAMKKIDILEKRGHSIQKAKVRAIAARRSEKVDRETPVVLIEVMGNK